MSEPSFRTDRTRVRRVAKRGAYDEATIFSILDAGSVCHIGFVSSEQPYVIPTIYARVSDKLYIHGAAVSRMMKNLGEGPPVSLTVTHLDGLVLARSAFHHSMNYRSVVVLGRANAVTDVDEKALALRAIVEGVMPGRWADVRPPSEKELRITSVVCLPISEASAKIRTGPPIDDEDDYALQCWAGVIPLALVASGPLADPRLPSGIAIPSYLANIKQ